VLKDFIADEGVQEDGNQLFLLKACCGGKLD
jgi:hypothetical protein